MRPRSIPCAAIPLLASLVLLVSPALAQPSAVTFRGLPFSATGGASLALSPGGGSLVVAGPAGLEPFGLSVLLDQAQGGGLGDFAFDLAELPPGLVSFAASTLPALLVPPELTLQWDGLWWACAGDQSGAGTGMVQVDYYLNDVLVATREAPHGEFYGQTFAPPNRVAAQIELGRLGPGDVVSFLEWRVAFSSPVDCFLADASLVVIDRFEVRPALEPLMLATKEMQEMNMSFDLSGPTVPVSLGDAWLVARSHEVRGVGQATIAAAGDGEPCSDCLWIDNLGLSGQDGAQTTFNPYEFALTAVVPWSLVTPVGTSMAVEAFGEVDGVGGLRVGRVEVEQAVGERIMRPDFGSGVRL